MTFVKDDLTPQQVMTLLNRFKSSLRTAGRSSSAQRITEFLETFRSILVDDVALVLSPIVEAEVAADFIERFSRTLSPPTEDVKPPSKEEIVAFLSRYKRPYFAWREELTEWNPQLNIWATLGLGEDEVQNCRILAWFLNPNEQHMQGGRFLRCLLRVISPKSACPEQLADDDFNVQRELRLGDGERVDISITGRSFHLIIEAKLNAPLSERQLERYWRNATEGTEKTCYGLFLTVEGSDPPRGDHHRFRGISWSDIARALRYFAYDVEGDPPDPYRARNPFVRALAGQYADYIDQHFYRR